MLLKALLQSANHPVMNIGREHIERFPKSDIAHDVKSVITEQIRGIDGDGIRGYYPAAESIAMGLDLRFIAPERELRECTAPEASSSLVKLRVSCHMH